MDNSARMPSVRARLSRAAHGLRRSIRPSTFGGRSARAGERYGDGDSGDEEHRARAETADGGGGGGGSGSGAESTAIMPLSVLDVPEFSVAWANTDRPHWSLDSGYGAILSSTSCQAAHISASTPRIFE